MARNTWNFPYWQMQDNGNSSSPRGSVGMFWEIFTPAPKTQPFSTSITGIFGFFMKTGFSDVSNTLDQGIFSIGQASQPASGIEVKLTLQGGNYGVQISSYDIIANETRYDFLIGGDASNWLVADKWYQMGYSLNDSRLSFAMNGDDGVINVVTVDAPGDPNLDQAASDRVWVHAGDGAHNAFTSGQMIFHTTGWGSMAMSPAAYSTVPLSFSDQTVIDRIWDENGDFKNPGQNGSLWFGDTYGDVIPNYYFANGSPVNQLGSDTQIFTANDGGSSGNSSVPGGLRKQLG